MNFTVEKRNGRWSVVDPITNESVWDASQVYPPNSTMDLSLHRLANAIAERFRDELAVGGGMA